MVGLQEEIMAKVDCFKKIILINDNLTKEKSEWLSISAQWFSIHSLLQ